MDVTPPKNDEDSVKDSTNTIDRRRVIQLAGTAGAGALTLALPREWTKPVVESILLPAHAYASPGETTEEFSTGAPPSGEVITEGPD